MSEIHCQLINLDDSRERLNAAAAQLSRFDISFKRVSAVDGRTRAATDFDLYDDNAAQGFFARPLTGGEVGCYMSHINTAQNFLDSGAEFGLVLEDDFQFTGQADASIEVLLGAIKKKSIHGFEIINLGKSAHKIFSSTGLVGDQSLQHAYYFPLTTTALLWSRAGAASFLAASVPIIAPVDHFFRSFFTRRGTGLALSPPLVQNSGAPSDIDAIVTGTKTVRKDYSHGPNYRWCEFRRQSANYIFATNNKYLRRTTEPDQRGI